MREKVRLIVPSPDGKRLATVSECIRQPLQACRPDLDITDYWLKLWDLEGRLIWERPIPSPPSHHHAVMRFSPDGCRLIECFNGDHKVRVWDVSGGVLLRTVVRGQADKVEFLEWFADGGRILYATQKDAAIYHVDQETQIARIESDPATRSDFQISPDGFIMAVKNYESIELWDAEGRQLAPLKLPRKLSPFSLAGCPGGFLVGTSAAGVVLHFELIPPRS